MNINSHEDSNSLFNDFLSYSSSISYVASGAGGIGLEVLNTDNKTYNILSTNNANVVCSKLFIKILPISNVEPVKQILNYSHSMRTDFIQVSVYSSSYKQFIEEVNIQNVIYKKSNYGLEPICPPIINAQIHDNTNAKQLIDLLIEKPDNNHNFVKNGLLSMLKNKLNNTDIKIGVIAMGFTENYISLNKALQIYKERKDFFQKLAVYELIRLYDLGYLHGDFSPANILINPDYIYTEKNNEQDKGRAMLIDFGASFSVPATNNNTDLSIREKINIMLDTPVPYFNNIILRTYDRRPNNWSWLENLNNGTTLNDMPQLIDTINRYNNSMISMIEDKYPDIYDAVRVYNNDLDYYVGGNEPTIFSSPLLTDTINNNTIKTIFFICYLSL